MKRTGKSRNIWHNKEGVCGGNSASKEFETSSINESGNEIHECDSDFAGSEESGSKRIRISPEFPLQDENVNLSEESNPLGLRLSKTPSFMNLLEMKLSSNDQTNWSSQQKIGSIQNNNRKGVVYQQYKASSFPAMLIKIGAWEKISVHEGEVLAKFYYAKRKLIWEVLDGSLKCKLEIRWSDIAAIRARIPDNQPGLLEIELDQPPLYFRETNPQPRKQTVWQQSQDFTGGQALMWRIHHLEFPPGVLDRHYDKLLQCDERLRMLSYKPFPSKDSPYFALVLDSNANGSASLHEMQHPCSAYPTTSTLTLGTNSNSTISVTDFLHTNENGANYPLVTQTHTFWPNGENFAACNYVQGAELMEQPCNLSSPSHVQMENAGMSSPSMADFENIKSHVLADFEEAFPSQSNPQPDVDPMCSLLDPLDVSADYNISTDLVDLDFQAIWSSQATQNNTNTPLLDDLLANLDLGLLMEPALNDSSYPNVSSELADNGFSTQNSRNLT